MAGMGVMGQMVCDAGNSGTQFTPVTLPRPGLDGGFCTIRSILPACRGSIAAIPPFAGGEVAVRGGMAPKVQTTSAKRTPGH